MILTLALLLAADTPKPPHLTDAQSSAIIQAFNEVNTARQLVEALQRLDAAQKALTASVADGQKTCGASPVQQLPNGSVNVGCPEPKPATAAAK